MDIFEASADDVPAMHRMVAPVTFAPAPAGPYHGFAP